FSGDYAQWSHFRNLFTSMVMKDNVLSAIPIISENLKRSWEILITRYENKRILIDAQLSALFAIRKLKTAGASEIKRLLDDIKEALDAFDALKYSIKSRWDHIIVFMIVRDLLKEWEITLGARSTPSSFGNLEQFLIGRMYTLESLKRVIMPFKQ
ncbi:hypothetical protein ALC56_06972, partial [Trachymyrmex septentrionalis]